MTIAERTVHVLLEDGPENYDDIIRDVAREATGMAVLKRLSDILHTGPSFGFSISTGDEYLIREHAAEYGIELTPSVSRKLTKDAWTIERNVLNILRKNGIHCQDHGHSDNELTGSAWLGTTTLYPDLGPVPTRKAMNVLCIMDRDDMLSTGSGNIMSLKGSNELFKDVSEIGQQVLQDIQVSFFDTEKIELSDWVDIWGQLHNLWPPDLVSEAKKVFLDFNQLIGNPPPPGVFVTHKDGVPIFSARCPGCKKIHGNFKTYEEASGNRQCKYCTRDFVDTIFKVRETGNYKPLLKKEP